LWRALGVRALFVFGVAGGAALVLAEIVEELIEGETMSVDHDVDRWLQQLRSPALEAVMRVVTRGGDPDVVTCFVAAMVAYAFHRRVYRSGIAMLLAPSVAGLVSFSMKKLFERERPRLSPRIDLPESFAFPSGHALSATVALGVAAIVMGRLHPRWRIPFALSAGTAALVIGFSRVYLGVHWPTDIAAGYAIGTILVAAGWFFSRTPEKAERNAGSPRVE
jgi:undecaprenyl-diphosphatase